MTDPAHWARLARLAGPRQTPDGPLLEALQDAEAMVHRADAELARRNPEAAGLEPSPLPWSQLSPPSRMPGPPPDLRAPGSDRTSTWIHVAWTDPVEPDPALIAERRDQALKASHGAFLWGGPAADAAEPSSKGVGPLAGFGIGVKDNLLVRGLPCTAGARMLAGFVAPEDAEVWRRLKTHGAHLVGKTNLDAFGMGASGEHSAFGPTGNPRLPGRVPGGSSSGSAAAVAAGWCRAALGSDTGGSVRIPAAYCGVWGFKPSYGALSRRGLIPFASSLDCVGILARSVQDLQAIFEAACGPDPRDLTSQLPLLEPTPTGRVAVLSRWRGTPGAEDVEQALQLLKLPHEALDVQGLDQAELVYQVLSSAEAASNLARYDGVRFGHKIPARDFTEMVVASRTEGFGLEVQRRILLGTAACAAGSDLVRRAHLMRSHLSQGLRTALASVDALVVPTTSVPPFGMGYLLREPTRMYEVDRHAVPANLAGLCALAVPLPARVGAEAPSVQLWGAPGADRLILRLGARLQQALRASTARELRRGP